MKRIGVGKTKLARPSQRLNAHGQRGLIFVMSDEARLPDPKEWAAKLPRGSGIILRHYGWTDARRESLAKDLSVIARRHGLLLFIGADARLALKVGAHGVHLPEFMISRPLAWHFLRQHPAMLVTASTHGVTALRKAQARRVDGVFLSPVFSTASHPHARPLGPVRFAQLAHSTRCAVFALGGMSRRNRLRLNGTACAGIGIIGAVKEFTKAKCD